MESSPPLPQPDAFIPYQVPVPSRRPGSVLALGIIGIVLSGITLLSGLVLLGFLIAFDRSPVAAAVIGASTVERGWKIVQLISSWTFYSALLWTSIGAIRLRPWARGGLVRWSWAYLAWTAVEALVIATWILPVSVDTSAGSGAPPGMRNAQLVGGYFVLAITLVLNIIYPIFAVVVMRKPHVRAAFADDPAAVASMTPEPPIPVASYAPVAERVPAELAATAPAGPPGDSSGS